MPLPPQSYSLGAAHISIDAGAMHLVHKCSMAFLEWGSLNADCEKVKADLDAVVASVDQWRSPAFGEISHINVDFVWWMHRGALANGSLIEGYSTLEKYPT